jgi:hypothetical protein
MVAIFQAIILKEKLQSAILELHSTLTQKEFYAHHVKILGMTQMSVGLVWLVLVATVHSSLLKSEADMPFVKLHGSG